MGIPVNLKVADKEIKSTEITYNDLIILYKQYIKEFGEVPTYATCNSKHNMPQGRIITRVLRENNITYNDFLLQFGKVSHVRTEDNNYDVYVKRFIQTCKKLGYTLRQNELTNNTYGLPNVGWLIKNCPNKEVKCYNDFVVWCGLESNKLEKDRNFVINTLINLEKKLGRPILKEDISLEKTGFSLIVLNRMFGGLGKAKEELGLMKSVSAKPLPFEFYKNKLDDTLQKIRKNLDRDFISWYDIENPKYNENPLDHKTLTKAFDREEVNIFAYIKSKGFMMNPSSFSFHYTFDDGERVVSSMEYDFSKYLKSLDYKYGKDYFRDVLYKTFSNEKSKMNCDYKIMIDDIPLYVEIAGIIYNCIDDDWRTHTFSSKRENDYRDKMLRKENRLIENNCNYIFLFKPDILSENYKTILQNKINEIRQGAS